jgi:DNA modification methylase
MKDGRSWPADKVERRNIKTIIPYARNSRTHSDEQVAQIAASIKEWGFTNPILVDVDGEVIAGHGRLLAAQKLGLDEVPCITAVGWSDAQKKAYVIADNKLALNAGWDNDMLSIEFAELKEMDFDLGLTGFDADELAKLLQEPEKEGLTDEDDVPEAPEQPVTVEGDVWILGNHRLMCGDSTSIDAIDKLMCGNKVDLVFTDPPYGMFLDTNYDAMFGADKGHRKTGKRFMEVAGDHDDFSPEFINTIFTAFDDVDEIFIWGADYFSELIPNRKNGSWVVWDKRTNQEMDKVSGNTFELCWSKKKHKRLIARILWSGHHGMQKDDTKKRVHPTQKPVELVKWFFGNWSKPKDAVVDLFGGSGSTLMACEQTDRVCFMMELDPKYCDVIIQRWQDFTGEQAKLEATGQTYDELKSDRVAA